MHVFCEKHARRSLRSRTTSVGKDLCLGTLLDLEETLQHWLVVVGVAQRRVVVLLHCIFIDRALGTICLVLRMHKEALLVRIAMSRWTELSQARRLAHLILLSEAELSLLNRRAVGLKRALDELPLILNDNWVVKC